MSTELPTLDQHDDSSSQSTLFHFVVDAFFHYWLLMLTLTTIGGMAGFAFSFFSKQSDFTYSAQASLNVKQSYWHNQVMEDIGGNVFGRITPISLVDSISMDELARDIAVALIQDDIEQGRSTGNITNENEINVQASEIFGQLHVEGIDLQDIIRIAARSKISDVDAKRLVDIATTVLIKHTQLHRLNIQRDIHELVTAELNDLRTKLEDAESEQWKFREEMGFQTEQIWDDMERKNSQLLESEIKIEVLKETLREKDEDLRENDERLPNALGNITDAVIQGLVTETELLRQEDVKLSVTWTEDAPERIAIRDEIQETVEATRSAIEDLKNNPDGGSTLWQDRQEIYRQKVTLNQTSPKNKYDNQPSN